MDLADPGLNETAGIQMAMTFNPERAEKLFAGSGHTFAEIAALAKDRKPLPHFALNVALKAHAAVKRKEVESANVLAKIPGTDPALKDEFVVLSAHVDHVGIGAPINGDSIYNGAMDNGSGSALLLDLAASLAGGEAAALAPLRLRDRRGERSAGLEVLRRAPHGRSESDGRERQRGHVPAHRSR